MSYVIRCLTGTTQLWSETFTHQGDASAYYLNRAHLAQFYGPTALPFRIQFCQGDVLIDEFETTQMGDGE